MLFAHLKGILRLARPRLRGSGGARDEFLLAATARNLRKLAKLRPCLPVLGLGHEDALSAPRTRLPSRGQAQTSYFLKALSRPSALDPANQIHTICQFRTLVPAPGRLPVPRVVMPEKAKRVEQELLC